MPKLAKFFAIVLAYIFIGLAFAGLFLPLLPTVPFLLLAAFFASKGSDRLHNWLYTHRHFGKLLTDWDREGAIPRYAKILACSFLILSLLMMYIRIENIWLLVIATLTLSISFIFIITRPEPGLNPQPVEPSD